MSDYLKELFIEEVKGSLGEPVETVGAKGSYTGCEIFNDYENNISSGWYDHAEGIATKTNGRAAHAEGENTQSIGQATHAEGYYTIASIVGAHAEGARTEANGAYSHAEGNYSKAQADGSHAEGYYTEASGNYSHTQGYHTVATHPNQNVIGAYNIIENPHVIEIALEREGFSGRNSLYRLSTEPVFNSETGYFNLPEATVLATSNSITEGDFIYRHADKILDKQSSENMLTSYYKIGTFIENDRKTGTNYYEAVQYTTSIKDYMKASYVHVVGNGTSTSERSNAHTLDWSGNAWYAGTIEGAGVIIPSSTEGSTKKFKITVDDSGAITATEITE